MDKTHQTFFKAFHARDIEYFMWLVFPPEWSAIRARILETGVTMSTDPCPWAPRWSPVSPTVRTGRSELATYVKSVIYRAHDCLHQLWGLPIPGKGFSEEDYYVYKRSQMCGEVAVLTLTEFALVNRLQQIHPTLGPMLQTRNALPMLEGPLRGRSIEQIAARLDTLLHKKRRPKWVREHKCSTLFCDDYVPMLEGDRQAIDHNWSLMKANSWRPVGAPNSRYSQQTDGLELTTWMIRDFYHLMDTDPVVDEALMRFNQSRRAGIVLPDTWNGVE